MKRKLALPQQQKQNPFQIKRTLSINSNHSNNSNEEYNINNNSSTEGNNNNNIKCEICGINLEIMSFHQRNVHVNSCIDRITFGWSGDSNDFKNTSTPPPISTISSSSGSTSTSTSTSSTINSIFGRTKTKSPSIQTTTTSMNLTTLQSTDLTEISNVSKTTEKKMRIERNEHINEVTDTIDTEISKCRGKLIDIEGLIAENYYQRNQLNKELKRLLKKQSLNDQNILKSTIITSSSSPTSESSNVQDIIKRVFNDNDNDDQNTAIINNKSIDSNLQMLSFVKSPLWSLSNQSSVLDNITPNSESKIMSLNYFQPQELEQVIVEEQQLKEQIEKKSKEQELEEINKIKEVKEVKIVENQKRNNRESKNVSIFSQLESTIDEIIGENNFSKPQPTENNLFLDFKIQLHNLVSIATTLSQQYEDEKFDKWSEVVEYLTKSISLVDNLSNISMENTQLLDYNKETIEVENDNSQTLPINHSIIVLSDSDDVFSSQEKIKKILSPIILLTPPTPTSTFLPTPNKTRNNETSLIMTSIDENPNTSDNSNISTDEFIFQNSNKISQLSQEITSIDQLPNSRIVLEQDSTNNCYNCNNTQIQLLTQGDNSQSYNQNITQTQIQIEIQNETQNEMNNDIRIDIMDILSHSQEPALNNYTTDQLKVICQKYGMKSDTRGKMITLLLSLWRRVKNSKILTSENIDNHINVNNLNNSDSSSNSVNTSTQTSEIMSYLKSNEELYLKIISFQPIELEEVRNQLKNKGINVPKLVLRDILDGEGIFLTSN